MIVKVKLSDICSIQAGGTPSRSNAEYWENGTIPWVKISDIKQKYLIKTEECINENGLSNSSAKIFSKGTILFTIFATLGEVCILDIDAATNQAIAGITIDSDNVDRDYLYHYLRSKKTYVNFIGRGVAQNNINMGILRGFEILLPPLSKQHEIAAILGRLDDLISLRKQQLAKLDELVKVRFVEMFGIPGTNPKGWDIKPLGDCCNLNPKKSCDDRLKSGLLLSFVPMPAVSEDGNIDGSDIRKYDEVKTGFTYFAENDVLFAKITPCMENGKGAIAQGLRNGIGFGSTEFHVLRPVAGKSNPYWLYTLTSFSNFRKDAAKHMTGSAGQRRVPASYLESFNVSCPPIDLQEDFALFAKKVNRQKLTIQQSLDKLEVLRKSLMQEYFG